MTYDGVDVIAETAPESLQRLHQPQINQCAGNTVHTEIKNGGLASTK